MISVNWSITLMIWLLTFFDPNLADNLLRIQFNDMEDELKSLKRQSGARIKVIVLLIIYYQL